MCSVIAYCVYIHNMYIIYIYILLYIHNWGKYIYSPYSVTNYPANTLQTLNYINRISKCNIIPYSHFPTYCHHSVYTPTHCEQY